PSAKGDDKFITTDYLQQCLAEYGQRENTRREHAALIRQHYQYREFAWPWTFRLTRLLPGINAFTRCRSLTSIALSGSRIVTANQTDS
ncbi:DUF4158 domain-containing protein, partial [Escherichia coli]